jgi:DNA-binding GntR family transcriptional regulator
LSSLPRINLRSNTVDAVADQLRFELVQGSIKPGDRIWPKELAKRFSVSHIPVREALRRLEAEDLISATAQGATFATDVRVEHIDGIYELRTVVEGEFAWRSAQLRGDKDILDAHRILAQLEGLDPYCEQFYTLHREFHWTLLAPAANEVIHQVLVRLWWRTDRYLAVAVAKDSGFPAKSHAETRSREHRELVAEFAAGDADGLRRSLVAHLTNTQSRLRSIYLAEADSE